MPDRHFSHGGFIPGIEGMRALAVLAVLLFHLDINGIAGGYLGVDLFFVISGFIITRNILLDGSAGTFSLREFYVRRFRRLFPALLATILLTMLGASIVIPPRELVDAAASAAYAIFSLANIKFWLQSGYFDAAADTKPLLHTWSLGVEEQFYLFWPALLIVVSGARLRFALVFTMLSLSLIFSLVYRDVASSAIFYLLPFRLHQLMAGALVAILSLRVRGPLGDTGLLLATVSFVGLVCLYGDGDSPAIGAALVTLIGVFLLLGRESSLAVLVYGNAPMQWIGKRSYALYLVHWPLVVLFKYAKGFYLGIKGQAFLFVVSFLCAVAMHELVEKPFRKRGADVTGMQRAAISLSLGTTVLLLLLVLVIVQKDGFKQRGDWFIQRIVESSSLEMNLRKDAIRYGVCNLHEVHTYEDYNYELCANVVQGKPNVLVLGDSMAADIYMMLSATYPDIHFLQATAGACAPVVDLGSLRSRYPACLKLNTVRFSRMLDQDLDLVVLAGMWWMEGISATEDTVRHIEQQGIPVLLFGPRSAYFGQVPTLLAREKTLYGVNERLASHVIRHDSILSAMREQMPDTPIVDMHEIQCVPDCISVIDGQLLYIDAVHFTPLGAEIMGERSRTIVDLHELLGDSARK